MPKPPFSPSHTPNDFPNPAPLPPRPSSAQIRRPPTHLGAGAAVLHSVQRLSRPASETVLQYLSNDSSDVIPMTETLHYPASVTRKSLDGILPSPRTLHIAEKMGSPLFITETGIVLSRVQSSEAMVQARIARRHASHAPRPLRRDRLRKDPLRRRLLYGRRRRQNPRRPNNGQ